MTEKSKQRLIVGAMLILGAVVLWLLFQNHAVAPGPSGVNNIAGNGSAPTNNISIGGNTYNIPDLGGGAQVPSVNIDLGNGGVGPCSCNTCGCDSTANSFSSSVGAALNNYSQQIAKTEQDYATNIFGNVPDWISQYIAIADPTAPSSFG